MSTETDGGLEWAREQLPKWRVEHWRGAYLAKSPTHDRDGIALIALEAQALVDRVRSFVRLVAIAQERAGRHPPGVIAGVVVTAHQTPVQAEPAPAAPAPRPAFQAGASDGLEARAAADPGSFGFTGSMCTTCGSMQMVRNGSCEKCMSCGETSGCS